MSELESLGYGGGYRYPHDFEGHHVAAEYLPEALRCERIVKLCKSGLELELAERWRTPKEKAKE